MKMHVIGSMIFSGLLSYSQASAQTPLEGIWVRPCHQGSMQVQVFENLTSHTNEIFFEDRACEYPLMAFINDGRFQLQNQQIDFQFEEVFLVLYSDKLISDYNQRAVCGKTDWRKNDVVPITGRACALFQESKLIKVPAKGDLRFGIWEVRGQKLYFGQLSLDENGSSPEKRPTVLDPRAYLKQPSSLSIKSVVKSSSF